MLLQFYEFPRELQAISCLPSRATTQNHINNNTIDRIPFRNQIQTNYNQSHQIGSSIKLPLTNGIDPILSGHSISSFAHGHIQIIAVPWIEAEPSATH